MLRRASLEKDESDGGFRKRRHGENGIKSDRQQDSDQAGQQAVNTGIPPAVEEQPLLKILP